MDKRKSLFVGLLVLMLMAATSLIALGQGLFAEPEVEVLYSLDGDGGLGGFGWVAAPITDLNGDGAAEVIVTAPFFADGANNLAGKIYIYSGADGSLVHATVGSNAFAIFGHSATFAGDVNGDGVEDYVVGAPGLDVFGTGSGLVGQVFVYSGADHSLLLTLTGPAGIAFGASVSGAGDVNHDGFGDILVGSTYASERAPQGGQAAVYSGTDGSLIWEKNGRFENGFMGSAVGKLEDLNHDGAPELIVGAQGAGNNGRGRAYLFSGRNGRRVYTMRPVGRPGVPATFAQYHASNAGDITGDGIDDIFIGDYNASRPRRFGEGTSGSGQGYIFNGKNGRLVAVQGQRRLVMAWDPAEASAM